MPKSPPPNVKVYDRPERTGPSPVIVAVVVLVLLIVGYFIYHAMHHPETSPRADIRATSIRTAWREEGVGRLRSVRLAG